MTNSTFFALLKNESRVVAALLGVGILYVYLGAKDFRQDYMFDLTPSGGTSSLLFVIPFMMWNFVFENQSYGLKPSKSVSLVASLEFMFTRAISRVSLFCAKTALYLIVSSMPLILTWAYSFTAPLVRVELPYNTHQHREETKEFYLSHFEGAHLQEPDDGANKDYVILPEGRTDQAVYGSFLAFAFVLLFQATLFSFARRRWIPMLALFVVMMIFMSFGASRKPPSLYEVSLVWVTQHTLLAFLGLVLLTVLAQLYCCRRFVNTEITS